MNELRERLGEMGTDELVDALQQRDLDEWRPEVFPIMEEILRERGVAVPEPAAELVPGPVGALVSVAQLPLAMNASLFRMALGEAGIQAWLSTEHLAGVAPHLGLAVGVDVLVREEDAAAAREVLASLESGAAEVPEEPQPCPACGSERTEHVEAAARFAAASGFLLAGTPLPRTAWHWHCPNCGHDWE